MDETNIFVMQNACLACGSTDFVEVGVPGEAFTKLLGDREFVQPRYSVRRCSDCQLVFKSHVAAPQVLDNYYAHVPFSKWAVESLYPTERVAIEMLRQLPHGSRVLDFGCSEGRLLNYLGTAYNRFGHEINEAAIKVAQQRGLTMLSEEQVFSDSATFNAVVLMDVFEHLSSPTELLSRLSDKLSNGGRLILSTGNSDAPAVRGDPANFWYFRNIEHLCMLNAQHAKWLGEKLGLKLVATAETSHYDTPWKHRIFEKCRDIAFEAFHRKRYTWLIPLFRRLPGFRSGRHWTERPPRCGTPDHLVLCLEKR